jgi:TatD DNase family protein
LLVDTHCHLNLDQFADDLDEVIESALQIGVVRIIVPGVDLPTSEKAIEISCKYDGVFAAVGIHPNYASRYSENDVFQLESLTDNPKVVAIGEIGFDKYRDFSPLQQQLTLLEAQLELSRTSGLPSIIHSRAAVPELISILTKWQMNLEKDELPLAKKPGVMHAFEGTIEEAKLLSKMDFKFGLGGAATYNPPRIDLRLLTELPLESFLFETDSPYLAPNSYRGKRNEPAYICETVQMVSGKINVSFEKISKISTNTANSLFSLGVSI